MKVHGGNFMNVCRMAVEWIISKNPEALSNRKSILNEGAPQRYSMNQQFHPQLCTPKEGNTKTTTYLCTGTFTIALFTIAKWRKQPKGLSTAEWINKMWWIHTMAYYSSIKGNKVQICAIAGMNLKNTKGSESSYSQRNVSYCRIPFTQNTQDREIYVVKKQINSY